MPGMTRKNNSVQQKIMNIVHYLIQNGICSYHTVSAPKYRRKAIYGKLRGKIGKYLRQLCEYTGVEKKQILV